MRAVLAACDGKRMRKLGLPLILLFFAPLGFAQFTNVTGTVVDPNNFPYIGATLKAQLVLAGAGVNGQPTVTVTGVQACRSSGFGSSPCQVPIQGTIGPVTLDAGGSFSLSLADNALVTPAATQWLFTVTIAPGESPPVGFGPRSFFSTITITGANQSVSVTLSAVAPALTRLSTGTGIGVGGGSVNSVSSGNLAPLFTTSVSNPTTTPSIAYTLTNAAANTVFGNCTAVPAAPSFCSLTAAMLPGSGFVTSVGLGLPGQFTVSGSPVTSTGTLTGTWNPVPANYFFGGPQPNSIGGIFDGAVGTVGNSTTPSATLTPTTSHDWAFTVFQSTGQAGLPTMPGSWTSTVTNGNQAAVFRQELVTPATITAPVTLTTSATWAQILFLLRLPGGSPTIVQTQVTGGAFSTAVNTFPGNTVTGNSILAVFCAPATGGVATVKFTDALGNIYTQIAFSQNGTTQEICTAALTATIVGGTTDPVTVVATNTSGNSLFWTAEISNIAAATAEPVFEPILASALQNAPTVNKFCNTTLGGNVAVPASTDTSVMALNCTMPATGCPCRAFLSYSVYPTWAVGTPAMHFWVSDGTNKLANFQTGTSNAGAGGRTSGAYSAYSTVTYGNSATVTFTLLVNGGTGTATIEAAPQDGSAQNSSFQVVISTSN